MNGEANSPGFDTATVLGKVMTLLYAFGTDEDAVPLTELTARTGLTKATTHRLLADLTAVGLVERDGLRYRLGHALYELGLRASAERELREIALPFLQDLYERTHETVHLAIRDGVQVVYIEKIGGHRQARSPSRVGGRMPMHSTALGKALLAYSPDAVLADRVTAGLDRLTPHTITAPGMLRRQLAKVAETGVAFEREESAVGLNCVAAAILSPTGEPIAAVSVSGPTGRFKPEAHAYFVRAVAGGIATTLARRAALRTPQQDSYRTDHTLADDRQRRPAHGSAEERALRAYLGKACRTLDSRCE